MGVIGALFVVVLAFLMGVFARGAYNPPKTKAEVALKNQDEEELSTTGKALLAIKERYHLHSEKGAEWLSAAVLREQLKKEGFALTTAAIGRALKGSTKSRRVNGITFYRLTEKEKEKEST